jgi:hypothetical protein
MPKEGTRLIVLIVAIIITLISGALLVSHSQGWIKLPFADQHILMANSVIIAIGSLVIAIVAWSHRLKN